MEFEKLVKRELREPMELRRIDVLDDAGDYALSVKLSVFELETERVGEPGARGVRLRARFKIEVVGPAPPEEYVVLPEFRDGVEGALAEGIDQIQLLGRLVESIDPRRQPTGPCFAKALALWQSRALDLVVGSATKAKPRDGRL